MEHSKFLGSLFPLEESKGTPNSTVKKKAKASNKEPQKY
jgi:hypothetical protein